MKWLIKYMVDPGDGIVSTEMYEHDSDDIIEVLADYHNSMDRPYWVMGIEAQPGD